jgi:hypothetical protein
MPNSIKYSASAQTLALKKGNLWIGTGDVGKGPSSTTGYYNGVTPAAGGYTIYSYSATQTGNLSYFSASNDAVLIAETNRIAGTSYTTAAQCLDYFSGQTDRMACNIDYPAIVTNGLVMDLDAGFTPSYPTTNQTWYDISSGGNNGTLTNSPTFDSGYKGSIVFDAIDDYVNCGSGSSLNSIVTYTVSTWFNLPTVSRNYNPIFCRHVRGTTSSDIEIYGGNGGITLVHNRDNGGSITYVYAQGPASNTPVMYTVTYGQNAWKTYFNGSLNETFTSISPPLANSGYVTDIGQFYSGPYFLQGKIYSQQVYGRVLSDNEVLQNFNATKTRFGL